MIFFWRFPRFRQGPVDHEIKRSAVLSKRGLARPWRQPRTSPCVANRPPALPFAPTANLPPSQYGKPQRIRARTMSQRSFVGLSWRTSKPIGHYGIAPTMNKLPHLFDRAAFWSRLSPPALADGTPPRRRFSALFLRLYIRNSGKWSGCRPTPRLHVPQLNKRVS